MAQDDVVKRDVKAIRAIERALEPLDPRARVRVVAYVLDRLGVACISISNVQPGESE